MKPGRNDPCLCGSGRKYKKCCEQPGRISGIAPLLAEARLAIQQGRLERAGQLCGEVLANSSHHADALHLMGVVSAQTGQNERAVELIREAIASNPDDAMAITNLAVSLHALGRNEDALEHLHKANRLNPQSPHTLRNLAVVLSDLGRWAEAATYLDRWRQLEPANAEVYRWMGDWHSGQHLREQAVPCYLKALELDPGEIDTASNLGACLAETGRRESALALLCKIVELNPNHAGAWGNLGVATKNFGDLKTALHCCERALALEPGDAKALWNRSLCLLGMGRIEEGWKEYEWRWQSGAVPRVPALNQPRWDSSDPAGKKILVWAEQGLGDQILFFSMVPDLIRAGAHCVVECDWRLVKLLQRSFAAAEILPMCEPPHPRMQQPDIDFQIPVASLARWFRPSVGSFPPENGYLVVDPLQVRRWKERLAKLGDGLKVGICWRSGITRGARSIYYSQLNQWGPILTLPGIQFANLQYGPCEEELREAEALFGTRIHVWQDMDLKDNQDGLAALIASLDLVISAGTAVDSLAGAVGVPTWVLTRGIGDWWALGTEQCPWSPSVRTFRSGAVEPWEPAIARIAAELREMPVAAAGAPEVQPA